MGKPKVLYSGNVIDEREFGQIFGGGGKKVLDTVRSLRVGDQTFEFTIREFHKLQELVDLLVAENERMASVLRFDYRMKPIVRVRAISTPTIAQTAISPTKQTYSFERASVRAKALANKATARAEYVRRLADVLETHDPLNRWNWPDTCDALNRIGFKTQNGLAWHANSYRDVVKDARKLVLDRMLTKVAA